jgi:hypothetical protein
MIKTNIFEKLVNMNFRENINHEFSVNNNRITLNSAHIEH